MPQYWDDDPAEIESKKGNAGVFSRTWGVPVDRITRYLANWGMIVDDEEGIYRTVLKGKAYPTDRFEYGDYNQMEDFLFALGGRMPMGKDPDDPYYDGEFHRFLPPPEESLNV